MTQAGAIKSALEQTGNRKISGKQLMTHERQRTSEKEDAPRNQCVVLPARITPFAYWPRPCSTGSNRGAHGITSECQTRKHAMGRELKEIERLSRLRRVSYLTSKKANITRTDRMKKLHRAIKPIKYARDPFLHVHTQQKNMKEKIKHK